MKTTESAARIIKLSDEEAVRTVLAESVLGLWKVVNSLSRLRPSARERYRVAIFGSARAQPGTPVYEEVKRVAEACRRARLRHRHRRRPGVMQAANEGAKAAGAPGSIGIRVELPFEQDANPFVEQAFEHETFFTRLQHFVIASDAFVVVPGGIGTVLETLMIWQLLQVRHAENVPLVLVGRCGKDSWTGRTRACSIRGSSSPARRPADPPVRGHRGRGDRPRHGSPRAMARGPVNS
jgi:predicted Rossmann-fold nucleotide-binding protein